MVLGACSPCANGEEPGKQAFEDFISQYQHIEALSVSCEVEETMTRTPDEGEPFDVSASGDARFWYAGGKYKLISSVAPDGERGDFLDKRMRYGFDGDAHTVYLPLLKAFERTESAPTAGAHSTPNPALMPVLFLRSDLPMGRFRHPGQFHDPEHLMSLIESHRVRTDALGKTYHEIRLVDPRHPDDVYRVYFEDHESGVPVVHKLDHWRGQRLEGFVYFLGYQRVDAGGETPVLLPTRVQAIAIQDDEPFYESIIDVTAYSGRVEDDPGFFRVSAPEGEEFVDVGEMDLPEEPADE